MYLFSIPKLSCGGCVATVTKAVQAIDPAAGIDADLKTKIVTVRSDAAADRLASAITAAGYPTEIRSASH